MEGNLLTDFLTSEKPMLLILGNRGSDKTKLLSDAVSHCDPSTMILRLKGRMRLHPTVLPELFRKHWAVATNENDRLNESLNSIIQCLHTQQQTCLLLIDNAHLLSIAVLAALCHLAHQQENKRVVIRMVLAGNAELVSKINALYLKKFTRPPTIRLPDPIPQNHMRRFSFASPKQFFSVAIQAHSIKIISAATLILVGFFFWKMEHGHRVHSIAAQPQPALSTAPHNDHAKA